MFILKRREGFLARINLIMLLNVWSKIKLDKEYVCSDSIFAINEYNYSKITSN